MPSSHFNFTLEDMKDRSSFTRAVGRNQANITPYGERKPLVTTRAKDQTQMFGNLTVWSYSDIMQGYASIKPTGIAYDVFNQNTSNSLVNILTTASSQDDGSPLGINQLLTPQEQAFGAYDVIASARNGQQVGGPSTLESIAGNVDTPHAGTDAKVVSTYNRGDITIVNVQGIWVNQRISGDVNNLINAAKSAGINFTGGGFRDYKGQIEARKRNGCPDIYTSPAKSCKTPTARPGQSMHELGEAIDFSDNGGKSSLSRSSRGFTWLKTNAARYGLQNLPSEPWHWSTNGK